MLEVAVYRVDYGRKIKDPIGTVFEKRKTERANNYLELLWLARRLFASDAADALHIVIDVRHAREGCLGGRALLKTANVGHDAGVVDTNDTGAFIGAAKTRQRDREKSVRTLA